MTKMKKNEKGFTLVEVVVTLVLVGIIALLAGMWIVSVANGYIFARTNASTTQKAQLAITRLTKEFTNLQLHSVTGATAAGITFDRANNAGASSSSVSISQTGSLLRINVTTGGTASGVQTLTDSVSAFSLSYCPSISAAGTNPCGSTTNNCAATWDSVTSRTIRIDLTLTAGSNIDTKFTQCVTPRNM